MVETTTALIPLPEEDFVVQSAFEAAYLPDNERQEQRDIVGELIGDLASQGALDLKQREKLLTLFDENIRIARGNQAQVQAVSAPVQVDFSKIGWSQRNEERDIATESITANDLDYRFVDLTSMNNATKRCMELLAQQTTAGGDQLLPKLLSGLKKTALPTLYDNIKHGRNLRPVSRGNRRDGDHMIDTEYPSYKIGLQGTNNRALILLLGDGEANPVFGLVALYDHDDDDQIYRALE